jgi:asparagine synthase (glutamine-hydrolysing)
MCGIAGVLNLADQPPPDEGAMRRMLAMIRHRGPDEFGVFLGKGVALGSARLSIVDLSTGQQPISNEDDTLWIVFNGEVFNHVELRPELEARGHRFKTHSDTEAVLHAFEEYGPACLERFNGQFAFAIWNSRAKTLFLARDRLGVRPLFYAEKDGALIFGSEIKALLAEGRLTARLDPAVLGEVFTFWGPLSSHTIFEGIRELPPGHYLMAQPPDVRTVAWWEADFPASVETCRAPAESEEELIAELARLLEDAACVRLRADVPVGAYLSGGLDSSVIAALVRERVGERLHTFSIAFDDAQFDESEHQLRMARHLGTEHHILRASHAEIGRVFPEVIWHAEAPLMRTAPAPMFLLSGLVRQQGFKVVLTGEGADEFLAGYDIFKEARVRRFWSRQPDSKWRPRLLQRLYPDIAGFNASNPAMLAAFFGEQLGAVRHPCYSHLIRWRNNRRTCRFFSGDVNARIASSLDEAMQAVHLPAPFQSWGALQQAQYLEIATFLSPYLLSSQGDRMGMAHSVEGRFPFLDHRVVEFCNRLPARMKLRGLVEKYALRQVARRLLPPEILERRKRPYRAPIHRCFFGAQSPDYVNELLAPDALKRTGLFKPEAVAALVAKLRQGRPVGETDDMALAGILSTQLLHFQFVEQFRSVPTVGGTDRVKVCNENRKLI